MSLLIEGVECVCVSVRCVSTNRGRGVLCVCCGVIVCAPVFLSHVNCEGVYYCTIVYIVFMQNCDGVFGILACQVV